MWRWLCWWQPPCLLRRVVLQFAQTETEAFEGVLWSSRGSWLTLRDVSALKAGKPPQPIPGEVLVHRSQILYLQVLS